MFCRLSGLPGSENEGEVQPAGGAGGDAGDTSIGDMQGEGDDDQDDGEEGEEEEKPMPAPTRGIKIKLGKRKPQVKKGKKEDSDDEE